MNISILIANYNNANYLVECLDSLANQTYKNFEVIFVDDASTDNSLDIVNNYKKFPIRIFTHSTNLGCGATKADCIDYASNLWCGFLDPDDTLESNAIEEMIKVINSNPGHCLYYSTHYRCNSLLEEKQVSYNVGPISINKTYLEEKAGTISHFVIFNRDIICKQGNINRNISSAVDMDLYLKLEEFGKAPLFINKPLYNYRIHDNGISNNYEKKLIAIHNSILVSKDAYSRRNLNSSSSERFKIKQLNYWNYYYKLQLSNNNILGIIKSIYKIFSLSPGFFMNLFIFRKSK